MQDLLVIAGFFAMVLSPCVVALRSMMLPELFSSSSGQG